jgi:Ca2+/Na+ antiporter
MNEIPHELALGDVYLSPLLPVFTVALLGAWVSTILLNKLRLSRYIMFPSTTFLTLMMLYILLMNTFWIRI